MVRRLAGFVLGVVWMAVAGGVSAADIDIAAVNRAGELRMLSQRIVKSYSQIGLNVLPTVAMRQMSEAIARFDSNLLDIRPALAAFPPAVGAADKLASEWATMRQATSAPVSREAALELSRRAEDVLAAAERLTSWLAKSVHQSGSVVNISGRQRMLSQRATKAYMLRSWGGESSSLKREMETAITEFDEGLGQLRKASENTVDINRELDEIAQQWEWFQAALAGEGAISYRLIVAESSDAILEGTDRVTRLYEQQARR